MQPPAAGAVGAAEERDGRRFQTFLVDRRVAAPQTCMHDRAESGGEQPGGNRVGLDCGVLGRLVAGLVGAGELQGLQALVQGDDRGR
ncbi:hypothetical protein ABZV67_38515 [Streptomyces sp. NPDC005065]|uniref:hypothetical protein n=1 Tax=unclassified Streptomyces TaxID=2593676 RepID=UPI0033A74ECC